MFAPHVGGPSAGTALLRRVSGRAVLPAAVLLALAYAPALAQTPPAIPAPIPDRMEDLRGSPTRAAPTWTSPEEASPVASPRGAVEADRSRSALEVIWASVFDDIYSEEARARWTPLPLGTFFSEGWDQPFVLPTAGSGGAPRQGWVGAFDGQFFRAWFFAFGYAKGINRRVGDDYIGRYTIFVPFNRRFEFQVDSLFVASSKEAGSNRYHTNVGDTLFWAKFQLSETKDFGQTVGLGVITPTGQVENGQGRTSLLPTYRFLWFPFGKWMIRGETGPVVPVGNTHGHTMYQNVLAAGRYFPGSEDGWFQHWWFYLVATQTSAIAGTPRRETEVTLLPGMRCRIPKLDLGTGLWYFFADLNVPVTGPRSFSYQPVFAILYDY